MKVLYDKINAINQSIFMIIQLDVGMDVSKHYFLKTFFLSFAASSWGETLFFFVIVLTPISSLCRFFFCRVSLSLSSYAFQDDIILLQSSWSTGDLKKLIRQYFRTDVWFDAFKSYFTFCIVQSVFICSRFVFELMISFIMLRLNNTSEEYTF